MDIIYFYENGDKNIVTFAYLLHSSMHKLNNKLAYYVMKR